MNNLHLPSRRFQYSTVIPVFLMLVDIFVIFLTLDVVASYQWWPNTFIGESFALLHIIFGLSWVLSGLFFSIYQVENLRSYKKIVYYILTAAILHGLILMLLFGSRGNLLAHLSNLLAYFGSSTFVILLLRTMMLRLYRTYCCLPFNRKNTIIIGCNERGAALYHYFVNNHRPQRVRGLFDEQASKDIRLSNLYRGTLADVQRYCLENNIEEIYYTLENHRTYLQELQEFAEHNFIYLGIVPDLDTDDKKRVQTELFDDGRIPVISFRSSPLRYTVNAHIKRAFDIAFSLPVLLLLCVTVFPIVALAIRLDSPGPIYFKQLRMGLNNQLFWVYKFRTMYVNDDENRQASRDDRRITRVGAFLRKTNLDEMPQFINVLIGNMSVVGPRPQIQHQLKHYSKHIEDYPLRASVPPGITGYAQVNGYRGETREIVQMAKRIEYDLIYMQQWSLSLDLLIIWQTIKNMLKGDDNAY